MLWILLLCGSLTTAPSAGSRAPEIAGSDPLAQETGRPAAARSCFESAVFTRNGRRAALVSRVGPPGQASTVLAIVDFGDHTERLVAGLHPTGPGSWSADGRLLATASRTQEGWTAVLVDAETLACVPVGPRDLRLRNPVWHPDGHTLLLNAGSAVYVTHPSNGHARLLGDGTTSRCVEPYWQGRWVVSRVTRQGGTLEAHVRHPVRHRFYALDDAGHAEEILPRRRVEWVVCSPDGQRAAAFCWPPGVTRRGAYTTPYSVWVVSGPQDRSPRKIAEGSYGFGPGVRWSNRGDRLVAMIVDPADLPRSPVAADAPLPTGPVWTWPGPSPGGTDLPFPPAPIDPSNREEPGIALLDPETRAQTALRLADGSPLTGMWPTWIGDDSSIVYVRWTVQGMREIWRYEFATKRAQRLYPFERS